MDYSLLDDVSTHDWTRYHELSIGRFFPMLPQDARVLLMVSTMQRLVDGGVFTMTFMVEKTSRHLEIP